MSTQGSDEARVIPLRPAAGPQPPGLRPAVADEGHPGGREPLWRDLVGEVLRRERRAQGRTLKDVAEAARISVPYLSELERGRKEGSSEVLAAAACGLGLGLADLLSLAQHELAARTASRVGLGRTAAGQGRTTSAGPYDGLCLAA